MIIRYIAMENFGSVTACTATFGPELNLLDTPYIPEFSAAIDFLLCSKQINMDHFPGENSCIRAGVLIEGIPYDLCTRVNEGRLQLTATDPAGADVTDFYRNLLAHCPEQDEAERFDGRNKDLPFQLFWYRNWKDFDVGEDLSAKTEQRAATKTFRGCLNRFIKFFQPEPVNCRKRYQVVLQPQGAFQVIYPGYPHEICLSETEEKLFLYICFLNIARFWADIEMLRDLHHEKKPLLIQNFLEYLDDATDISALLARTKKLQRQVIILTLPMDEKMKKKWIGEENE